MVNAERHKDNNRQVSVVMYHYVRDLEDSRFSEIKGLDVRLFREQIEYLCRNYNIIRIEDLIAALDKNINLPRRAALLTFDDGYIDHFLYVFPILVEKKYRGLFLYP